MQPSRQLDDAGRPPEAAADRQEFAVIRYDPARERERMRGWIAAIMTALFGLVIVLLGVQTLRGHTLDDVAKLSAVILTPVSSLLGAVVGFYYGEQSHR